MVCHCNDFQWLKNTKDDFSFTLESFIYFYPSCFALLFVKLIEISHFSFPRLKISGDQCPIEVLRADSLVFS